MGTGDFLLVMKLLFLVIVANGAPVLVKHFLGDKLSSPMDGGLILSDGQRLFGKAKTIRGVVSSLIATMFAALLINFEFETGAIVAAAAMIGDMLSSFLKRRMKIPSGGVIVGLDQIPEALFPALAAKWMLPLTLMDIVTVVAVFLVGALVFSRICFALKVRKQPY